MYLGTWIEILHEKIYLSHSAELHYEGKGTYLYPVLDINYWHQVLAPARVLPSFLHKLGQIIKWYPVLMSGDRSEAILNEH